MFLTAARPADDATPHDTIEDEKRRQRHQEACQIPRPAGRARHGKRHDDLRQGELLADGDDEAGKHECAERERKGVRLPRWQVIPLLEQVRRGGDEEDGHAASQDVQRVVPETPWKLGGGDRAGAGIIPNPPPEESRVVSEDGALTAWFDWRRVKP